MTTTAPIAAGGAVSCPPLPLNRYQRRAIKRRLKDLGHFTKRNGIAQATLTPAAYDRLVSLLEGHGNNLDDNHRTALMALVGFMTKMAQGELRGRWAFGLPTGLGKTSAIIAWCAALHAIGADHISVAVSASKVEALCNLKRDLIAQGVPPEKIGLVHSYKYDPAKLTQGQPIPDGFASEPSEGDGRQIMLVTHARVRGCDLSTFNTYQGRPRDLLIYDESLMVSDSLGIPFRDLKGAVGFLTGKYDDTETHAPSIA